MKALLDFWQKWKNPLKTQKIKEASFVVLDTELTGLDPRKDALLSIGAIKMHGGRILLGEIFYREVYSPVISQKTVPIHQILPSDLKMCPEISKILPEFLNFIKNCVLVGFHLRIDLTFLKKYLKKSGLSFPDLATIEVYGLYRWLKKKVCRRMLFISPWKSELL